MLCLAPELSEDEIVIGRKLPIKRRYRYRINGAVVRFPAGHALLEEATTFMRANLDLIGSSWRSVAGPDLLTRLVPQYGTESQETALFYPIGGDASWNFCDPEKRDEVAAAVSGSPMVHLWQERFRAARLPCDRLPPAGRLLAEAFARHGGAGAACLDREELRRFVPERRERLGHTKRRPARLGLMSRLLSAVRK